MTAEEAKKHQDQLMADGWDLSFWYGTSCTKCCGVFPKLALVALGPVLPQTVSIEGVYKHSLITGFEIHLL